MPCLHDDLYSNSMKIEFPVCFHHFIIRSFLKYIFTKLRLCARQKASLVNNVNWASIAQTLGKDRVRTCNPTAHKVLQQPYRGHSSEEIRPGERSNDAKGKGLSGFNSTAS